MIRGGGSVNILFLLPIYPFSVVCIKRIRRRKKKSEARKKIKCINVMNRRRRRSRRAERKESFQKRIKKNKKRFRLFLLRPANSRGLHLSWRPDPIRGWHRAGWPPLAFTIIHHTFPPQKAPAPPPLFSLSLSLFCQALAPLPFWSAVISSVLPHHLTLFCCVYFLVDSFRILYERPRPEVMAGDLNFKKTSIADFFFFFFFPNPPLVPVRSQHGPNTSDSIIAVICCELACMDLTFFKRCSHQSRPTVFHAVIRRGAKIAGSTADANHV